MSRKDLVVIDLTSPTLDEIIVIDSDESFEMEAESKDSSSNTNNLQLVKQKQSGVKKAIKHQEEPPKFGDCPICLDELGTNPLVSTKCGHVFCLKCLEKALKPSKRCPTCRCKLLGINAYHPLYLNNENVDLLLVIHNY